MPENNNVRVQSLVTVPDHRHLYPVLLVCQQCQKNTVQRRAVMDVGPHCKHCQSTDVVTYMPVCCIEAMVDALMGPVPEE